MNIEAVRAKKGYVVTFAVFIGRVPVEVLRDVAPECKSNKHQLLTERGVYSSMA